VKNASDGRLNAINWFHVLHVGMQASNATRFNARENLVVALLSRKEARLILELLDLKIL